MVIAIILLINSLLVIIVIIVVVVKNIIIIVMVICFMFLNFTDFTLDSTSFHSFTFHSFIFFRYFIIKAITTFTFISIIEELIIIIPITKLTNITFTIDSIINLEQLSY